MNKRYARYLLVFALLLLCVSCRERRFTPLMQAAIEGDVSRVKSLLGDGADINARDEYELTPIMHALTKNQTEVAELLVTRGADVNASDYI